MRSSLTRFCVSGSFPSKMLFCDLGKQRKSLGSPFLQSERKLMDEGLRLCLGGNRPNIFVHVCQVTERRKETKKYTHTEVWIYAQTVLIGPPLPPRRPTAPWGPSHPKEIEMSKLRSQFMQTHTRTPTREKEKERERERKREREKERKREREK
eukprot:284819338_2